jgi:transposase InsO family protein
VRCSRKTVAVSLRRQGLRAKAARRFKATTDANHVLPVAPVLLNQDFTTERANCKWVGDMTYLWTVEEWPALEDRRHILRTWIDAPELLPVSMEHQLGDIFEGTMSFIN